MIMRARLFKSHCEDGSFVYELRADPLFRVAVCFEADGSIHWHVVSRWYVNSWTVRS